MVAIWLVVPEALHASLCIDSTHGRLKFDHCLKLLVYFYLPDALVLFMLLAESLLSSYLPEHSLSALRLIQLTLQRPHALLETPPALDVLVCAS